MSHNFLINNIFLFWRLVAYWHSLPADLAIVLKEQVVLWILCCKHFKLILIPAGHGWLYEKCLMSDHCSISHIAVIALAMLLEGLKYDHSVYKYNCCTIIYWQSVNMQGLSSQACNLTGEHPGSAVIVLSVRLSVLPHCLVASLQCQALLQSLQRYLGVHLPPLFPMLNYF